MTTDIIIRSYSSDFEWLKYCLRSIQRFATGFRRTVVIVPQGQVPPTGTAESVFYIQETMPGYMAQQNDKLHADAFSDAEFLLFMDSDTIFTRPITPADAVSDCRYTVWLYTPYSSLPNDDAQMWKCVTEKALKQPVDYEFMRRHPLCAPRWALEEFRRWMLREHGMPLERYIAQQPNREFSEWNALGAWLWLHHRDKILWQNTDEELGAPFVHQSWSYGGFNPDIVNNLEAALA